ncbi:hypothetical protein IL992_25655 [Microbispora sp. NEAU-D428]|uniref:hypothetical protein n=1 Tax=Microbispora sitophila TaxID=2771537 RepID=UPI001865E4E1|nr:hypothetical protein [Microbispora sitophila]MBE3012554.1 hypothetical protein [Microbispora sitophila]
MVHFVYRSVYEGPSGRLVRHFPDATVLDWFRRVWDDAASQDAYTWVQRELGTDVYGLHTIFETGLPAPRTHIELRRMLKEHLYVEGRLRVDRHSVRVFTDDDEVELAYFFVDDHVVADEPDRWAYLVHESWDLPADAPPSVRAFTPPVPVDVVSPAPPGGEGVTYVVILTHYATVNSVGGRYPKALPGVRLPGLAAALRTADPDLLSGELRALRALIAPGDEDIGPALERCNRWARLEDDVPEILAPHPEAYHRALRLLADFDPADGRDPGRTLVRCDDHLAQMAIHLDGWFGYRQWFLFDDLWAAARPETAASLMRFGAHWDPRCRRRHARLTHCG